MALDIKVTCAILPGVAGTVGGTILVTDNLDGTYQLTTADIITYFRFDANKTSITQVEVISEDLTGLGTGVWNEGMFYLMNNMTVLIATGKFSSVTNFSGAWYGCTGLTTFPLIDTSAGINLDEAFGDCSGLTSFPKIDTSSANSFVYTWSGCTGLTSFPYLNSSAVTSFEGCWNLCSGLTSFPALDSVLVSDFNAAWYGCSGLTTFPAINISAGTLLYDAWNGCTGLTSFPNLDFSGGTNFASSWNGCTSLITFPDLNGTSGTSFYRTFANCTSLKCIKTITLNSQASTEMFLNDSALKNPTTSQQIDIGNGIDYVNTTNCEEDNISPNISVGSNQIKSIQLGRC